MCCEVQLCPQGAPNSTQTKSSSNNFEVYLSMQIWLSGYLHDVTFSNWHSVSRLMLSFKLTYLNRCSFKMLLQGLLTLALKRWNLVCKRWQALISTFETRVDFFWKYSPCTDRFSSLLSRGFRTVWSTEMVWKEWESFISLFLQKQNYPRRLHCQGNMKNKQWGETTQNEATVGGEEADTVDTDGENEIEGWKKKRGQMKRWWRRRRRRRRWGWWGGSCC